MRNNENQTVMVEEVEEIDFGKVKEHLEKGESVFITLKRKEKVEIFQTCTRRTQEFEHR